MSRGYIPDVSLNTFKLVMGYIIIFIALVAQFYKNKFPENRDFLAACVILYPFSFICVLSFRSLVERLDTPNVPPFSSFTRPPGFFNEINANHLLFSLTLASI